MRAPVLAALFLIITLANLAMPGTANFMGEFYILIGVFQSKIVFAFVASIGVVFAAYYAIRLFQRTMQNRRTENSDSREIGLRDALVLGPLVACIIALALYPGFILGRSDTSVKATIASDLPAPAPTTTSRRRTRRPRRSRVRCPGDPFDKSGATRRNWSQAPSAASTAHGHDYPMTFTAPHIDYAGLSPVIALSAGHRRRAPRPAS